MGMTRFDLFKKWLESQGVNILDFEGFGGDKHGCIFLRCPPDIPKREYGVIDCNDCPYNEFWTKELEVEECRLMRL